MDQWLRRWIPLFRDPVSKTTEAPRSTQPFINPKSIKLVPGTFGNLVVKSKMSPRSGFVAQRQLNLIHKKDLEALCIYLFICLFIYLISFNYLLIYLFIYILIYLFIYLFLLRLAPSMAVFQKLQQKGIVMSCRICNAKLNGIVR